jgi:enoyl-CoA hydratase/carnithine racemase
MTAKVVTIEIEKEVGIICLNRPDVHNVVNEAVMAELESILEQLDSNPAIRLLIVTGAGSETFCAGGDLKYFATLKTREQGLHMSKRMQAILNQFWAGPRVVIAAVNGQALGGGGEILTACHFRMAASTATFAFRQAANGIITGWGGGIRLFRLVGRTQALRLLLTAERIDAAEALRIGLVDRIVPPEKLMDESLTLARTIGRHSPDPIRAFLELARLVDGGDLDAAVQRETELFGDCWVSEDFRQIVSDFLSGESGERVKT